MNSKTNKLKNNVINVNSQNGITLIALVVTIIVLLILAGVSISILTGENGILTQSQRVAEAHKDAIELEAVNFAVVEAMSKGLGELTTKNLWESLQEQLGYGQIVGNGPWKYFGKRKIYNIDFDGKVTVMEKQSAEEIFANANISYEVDYYEEDGITYPYAIVRVNIESPLLTLKYQVNSIEEQWLEVSSNGEIKEKYDGSKVFYGDTIYVLLEYEGEQSEATTINMPNAFEAGIPGLYNSNNEILASWHQLESMGLDITQDYSSYNTSGTMYYLLSNNSSLRANGTKLVIGNISKIGNYACAYCANFKVIIIGNGVNDIGDDTFYYCTNVEEIFIAQSVDLIGNRAFSQCPKVKILTIDSLNISKSLSPTYNSNLGSGLCR